jgi:hypothetical protein
LRLAGVPEPMPATLINLSSGGMRVRVAHAAASQVTVGDMVDTTLGPDRIPVHARIVNREGDHLGLQFLITDRQLAGRVDNYLDQLLS